MINTLDVMTQFGVLALCALLVFLFLRNRILSDQFNREQQARDDAEDRLTLANRQLSQRARVPSPSRLPALNSYPRKNIST